MTIIHHVGVLNFKKKMLLHVSADNTIPKCVDPDGVKRCVTFHLSFFKTFENVLCTLKPVYCIFTFILIAMASGECPNKPCLKSYLNRDNTISNCLDKVLGLLSQCLAAWVHVCEMNGHASSII